jgi:DNA-binding Xre family transcriptional regulator
LRRKLSLNEVAARSGLSHTMVSRVEKRERLPTIDTLLRITGALDVDLAKLLGNAKCDTGFRACDCGGSQAGKPVSHWGASLMAMAVPRERQKNPVLDGEHQSQLQRTRPNTASSLHPDTQVARPAPSPRAYGW